MAQEPVLLVDFENVQQINLTHLPPDFRMTIFVGCAQKSIPLELVQQVQVLGSRVSWCRIEGIGHNALDFHIAYYLGRGFAQNRKAQYYILSKDTGFDPLVRHLTSQELCCKRIVSLAELPAPDLEPVGSPPLLEVAPARPAPKMVHATPSSPMLKPILVARPIIDPNYERVVATLKKADANSRPGKRESLTKHVANIVRPLAAPDVERLVNRLFSDGKVTQSGTTLTYKL